MGANIGWLFYKDYYQCLENDDYVFLLMPKNKQNDNNAYKEKLNKKIDKKVQNIIGKKPTIPDTKELGNTHFKATTTYPGLLLGSGNAHELPSIEGQAILGFYFDYTTGLPVISGSCIKGVLRSAFSHWKYMAEHTELETKEEVKKLEIEIFENADTFFDAEIIKANSDGKILGDDFLAPHKNSKNKTYPNGDLVEDELCNPAPLRFIKVLPEVTFRFDFLLHDGMLSKSTKLKLFQDILADLGLGAKTNVGYGKFQNFEKHDTKEEKALEELEKKRKKEQEDKQKEDEAQKRKQEKEQKAKAGIEALMDCKTFADGVKLLKESFTTAKPKLTDEQKQVVEKFYLKFEKTLSKKDKKALNKYGIQ